MGQVSNRTSERRAGEARRADIARRYATDAPLRLRTSVLGPSLSASTLGESGAGGGDGGGGDGGGRGGGRTTRSYIRLPYEAAPYEAAPPRVREGWVVDAEEIGWFGGVNTQAHQLDGQQLQIDRLAKALAAERRVKHAALAARATLAQQLADSQKRVQELEQALRRERLRRLASPRGGAHEERSHPVQSL